MTRSLRKAHASAHRDENSQHPKERGSHKNKRQGFHTPHSARKTRRAPCTPLDVNQDPPRIPSSLSLLGTSLAELRQLARRSGLSSSGTKVGIHIASRGQCLRAKLTRRPLEPRRQSSLDGSESTSSPWWRLREMSRRRWVGVLGRLYPGPGPQTTFSRPQMRFSRPGGDRTPLVRTTNPHENPD